MTREEAAKWAELMSGYANGGMIQRMIGGTWHDVSDPIFRNPCDEYRIKPEKKKVEFWLNVYESTCVSYDSKRQADFSSSKNRIACLHIVREYEEGEGL